MGGGSKIFLVAASLLIVSCERNTVSATASACSFSTLTEEREELLESILRQTRRDYEVVGQAAAVLIDGKLVYRTCQGVAELDDGAPITEQSIFPIFSISKLFFNTAFLNLVEAREVDVNAPLSTYLDDLPTDWGAVTVEQAWSHISGLPEFYRSPDLPETADEALNSIEHAPFQFETGTASRYNQTNFLLLKRIFEKVTGEDYKAYAERRLIEGAGLKRTLFGGESLEVEGLVHSYWLRDEAGALKTRTGYDFRPYVYASSGLNASIVDLSTWFSKLLDGEFVKRETLEHHWRAVLRSDGTAAAHAYGWDFRKRDGLVRIGHSGGNRVFLYHYARESGGGQEVTVVYLDNGGPHDFQYWILADRLAAVFEPKALSTEDATAAEMFAAIKLEGSSRTQRIFEHYLSKEALSPAAQEAFINRFGYDVFWALGAEKAILVFEDNVKRHPDSANVYDSLGEVVRAAGDIQRAYQLYSQALLLDPENQRIRRVVESIKEEMAVEAGASPQ